MIFFGIFAFLPGIICSIIAATSNGNLKIRLFSLIINLIGVILILCGYCLYVNGLSPSGTVDKAKHVGLFGNLAIICGHAIVLSLDNYKVGFFDDLKKRATGMSAGLFAVFGFINFIVYAIVSNKLVGDDVPRSQNACISAGYFFVSVASMIRFGIVYNKETYHGSNCLLAKCTYGLMAVGGIILVSGYWALADFLPSNSNPEKADLVGLSIFFVIIVAVNVFDMALTKTVEDVPSIIQ